MKSSPFIATNATVRYRPNETFPAIASHSQKTASNNLISMSCALLPFKFAIFYKIYIKLWEESIGIGNPFSDKIHHGRCDIAAAKHSTLQCAKCLLRIRRTDTLLGEQSVLASDRRLCQASSSLTESFTRQAGMPSVERMTYCLHGTMYDSILLCDNYIRRHRTKQKPTEKQ